MMETVLLGVLAVSGLLTASSYPTRYYILVYDQMNMTDAQKHCREKYTDLATIDSMEDVKTLNDMVASNNPTLSEAWIGLYNDVNSWRWSLENSSFYKDGEAEFRKWETTEPNNYLSKEQCTQMLDYGGWNDLDCTEKLSAICFNATGLTGTFHHINTTMTWTEAQSYCRQHYTDLASVRNQTENQKIQDLIPAGGNAWIGLFRDSWKWSDRSNSSFRNWNHAPKQPDNMFEKEACVVARFNESGKWDDTNCDGRKPFICYDHPFREQVVRVKLIENNPSLDLNDPAVLEDILRQFKQKLEDQGLTKDIKISWRTQTDGKVFHKMKKRTKNMRKPRMTKVEL